MTDTFARMRQLRGTTAEWAANDIVLGAGEIGIEVISASDIRMKNGDGTSKWSALPYTSATANTINSATQTALNGKVSKTGDIMTGFLTLVGNAVNALHAIPKQQYDQGFNALMTLINATLAKSGGAMTGPLTLATAPTNPMQAANKKYVDDGDALKVAKAGDTMTGALELPGDPVNPLEAATKQYVDQGPQTTVVGGATSYAGKIVRLNPQGLLDSSIAPVHSNYLGAVDITKPFALTSVPGNGDYFVTSGSGTIDPSWVGRIVGGRTTVGEGQFLIHGAGALYDLVGDTSSSAQIAHKLDINGGTMLGPIVLAGAPTAPMQAANKGYVDGRLPLAGGTMTGPIILPGPPTQDLHAADKKYVDDMLTSSPLFLRISGGTMTGPILLSGLPVGPLEAANKQYVDSIYSRSSSDLSTAVAALSANYQLADSKLVNRAGDTMAGKLTLAVDPTAPMDAVTKQYADSKAPLNSPVFTGSPKSVQHIRYLNTADIATTSQVYATVTSVPAKYPPAGNYQLINGDQGMMIWMNGSTLVVPDHASAPMPVNSRVDIMHAMGGDLTFSAMAGVTLLSRGNKRKSAGQWAGFTLWKQDVNQWVLIGDLVT